MKRFDSIRPYTDSEVQSVLQELSTNKDVVKAFISASKYSYLTKAPFSSLIVSKVLQSKIKDIHTIKDYQSIFENLVSNMIDTKTSGFTCNGFENIVSLDVYSSVYSNTIGDDQFTPNFNSDYTPKITASYF